MEGGLGAPVRNPHGLDQPNYLDEAEFELEARRVFDICHGCRRCFNLCDSFPKLFDMIDKSTNEDVESLSSSQFKPVVDACTLCDMCFMITCPYVPPHEFNIDFPHLMLRYRMYQKKTNQLPHTTMQLARIDRNAKTGIIFHTFINWLTNVKNKFFRILLQFFIGIDKRVNLPKYNNETFEDYSKKNFD